jgi:hypothetical protein
MYSAPILHFTTLFCGFWVACYSYGTNAQMRGAVDGHFWQQAMGRLPSKDAPVLSVASTTTTSSPACCSFCAAVRPAANILFLDHIVPSRCSAASLGITSCRVGHEIMQLVHPYSPLRSSLRCHAERPSRFTSGWPVFWISHALTTTLNQGMQ